MRFGISRAGGPFSPIITAQGWELSWWWFWERGAPVKGRTVFNARAEHLTRGLWREPFRSRRVLIPVSHYFEMANAPGAHGRFRFALPGEPVFAIAGISALIEGAPVPSCFAMVTRPPTAAAGAVHDRMPLALPAAFHEAWLDPDRVGDEALRDEALAASDEIVQRLVITEAR